MSKNGGMGSKKNFSKTNKGLGKCSVGSHGEQCGKAKEVSKGENLHFKPIKPIEK